MSKQIAVLITVIMLVGTSAAHAGVTTIEANWSGVRFSNTGFVTMQVNVDPDAFDFDLGPAGIYDHAWWYSSLSDMTVVVTGSTKPGYNGIFYTNSMAWVRIYSNEATPTDALNTPGGAYADLGANYQVDYTPSDSGIGLLQLGATHALDGEYVGSLGATAVPEPTLLGLICSAVGLLSFRHRSSLWNK